MRLLAGNLWHELNSAGMSPGEFPGVPGVVVLHEFVLHHFMLNYAATVRRDVAYYRAEAAARYGVELDASLITGIDPPHDVEAALAAINTAHNHVSSDISLADASADQKIVQSKRAVEIETLKAQAEVEPLQRLAAQLRALKTAGGKPALDAYVRNVKLELYHQSQQVYLEERQ